MKRKFLVVFLAIVATFCMAFGFAACGEKSDETGNNSSITDPSDGEQGGTQKPDEGEQGGTQKPDEVDQGGTQKPDEGDQGGTQKPNESEQGGTQKPDDGEQGGTDEHVHTMTKFEQQDPTCTAEGKKAYWHCSGCNKNYLDQDGTEEVKELTIPKLSHNMTEHAQQNATCTAVGKVAYWHCNSCGRDYLDLNGTQEAGDLTIAAVGHALQKIDKTEPTCTTSGNMEYYHCEKCNKDFAENNNFTENALESTILQATGHSLQKHEKKEATCLENGNIEYFHCEKCNKDFAENNNFTENALESTILQATGHFLQWQDRQEPTCTAAGFEAHYHCSQCNKNFVQGDIFAEDVLESVTLPATHFRFMASSDDEYTVAGLIDTCNHAEVEIPGEYAGRKVIGIEKWAFWDCGRLTSIKIPDSVTSIGENAFEDCSGLTSIDIPDSVTEIGKNAFLSCGGLTSVTIGSGVTAIGESAFYRCDVLENITVNEKNQNYSSYDRILYNKAQTEIIHVPKAIKGDVTISNGVISIGDSVFMNCFEMTGELKIPDSVTSIGYYAFYACRRLTSVIIGNNVTKIEECAFGDCRGLTSVIIGNNVTEIGENAFGGCHMLVEVWNYSELDIMIGDFENGHIGYNAKQIYNTNVESKQTKTSDGYYFYEDNMDSYLLGYVGTSTELILPEKSPKGYNYKVNRYAFYDCSELTSVTFGGVISIEEYAFCGCSKLTSVTFPDSVTSIGDLAFYDCSGLTSVTIGSGVTEIAYGAFGHCSNLTSIDISDSVTSIGENAFLDTAYYNNNSAWTGDVLYIGNHLIKAKNTISGNYSIRGGTKTIADSAFRNCDGLNSIDIPDSVTSIGDWSFYECSELTAVSIGNGVTSIGICVFSDCNKIKEVHFEHPSGWKVSLSKDMSGAESISGLYSTAIAIRYLTDTYCWFYWKREG